MRMGLWAASSQREDAMSNHEYTPGRVVWRELSTKDLEKAKRFYTELFGWSYDAQDMGAMGQYLMIRVGERNVGGIMQQHGDMTALPSHWMSYVSVADVDAAANAARANGGTVAHGPTDIPDVGRFAVIVDADGAVISAFKSKMGDPAAGRPNLGEFCWETLTTKDGARAKQFYSKVMGWQSSSYQGMDTFGLGEGMEKQIADIHLAQGPVPPNWLTFVAVADADAVMKRAGALGGQVAMPGMDIPTIGRIGVILDDQGAALGIFQPAT
jgi:predicted enzyme related to lactoylglutathione lyase